MYAGGQRREGGGVRGQVNMNCSKYLVRVLITVLPCNGDMDLLLLCTFNWGVKYYLIRFSLSPCQIWLVRFLSCVKL